MMCHAPHTFVCTSLYKYNLTRFHSLLDLCASLSTDYGPGLNDRGQKKTPLKMSNSEAENNSKFQKLTGKNYNVWAIQIQSQLMTANAWRIITGELKKPSDPKQLEPWLSKSEEAAGIIISESVYTVKNKKISNAEYWGKI